MATCVAPAIAIHRDCQRFPIAFRFSSLRASVGTPLESCQAVESGPITYSDSLLSSVRLKSRRPAEHEREPSERIRRETQETIAIWSHSPELLVARDRWDRNTGRRQDEFFSEPHVHLYDLPVWSDVEERLPVRSPEWGRAACRGHAYRATRTRQATHVDVRMITPAKTMGRLILIKGHSKDREKPRST